MLKGINLIISISGGIALLIFFAGIIRFIWESNNEKKRNEGKQMLLWGLVALFVMFSLWGIIKLAQTALLPTY